MVAERTVIRDPRLFPAPVRGGSQAWVSSAKPGREASGGEIGSENADVSSDKGSERLPRRKSKGSCVKLICAG